MHFALESTFLPTLIANIVNQKLQEDLKKIITSQYFLHYQSLSDLLKQIFFSRFEYGIRRLPRFGFGSLNLTLSKTQGHMYYTSSRVIHVGCGVRGCHKAEYASISNVLSTWILLFSFLSSESSAFHGDKCRLM